MKRGKKKIGLNRILTVSVKIGESSYPDGRDVVWKAEKECDLILDQFGTWLAGLMRAVPGANAEKDISLKDITNIARTIRIYGTTYPWIYGQAGTKVGVGSSNQAAGRTDYNLISILGALTSSGDGSWNSSLGQITVAGSVYLSAGGTVRETGLFSYWYDASASYRTFMLFRDVVSDVVIAAGKYAHVAYTIQC